MYKKEWTKTRNFKRFYKKFIVRKKSERVCINNGLKWMIILPQEEKKR